MFVGITNTPKDYDWGSTTALAEALGTQPSGKPEAELWLGAHPLAPSRILEPQAAGGARTLDEFIAADPERALGAARERDTLPFLLKVLAAEGPLSIQAHPSAEQAVAGFAREERAGIALDSPTRSYKDDLPKPELALALSETFEALAGFREVALTRALVEELRAVAVAAGDEDAVGAFGGLAELLAGSSTEALRRVLAFALGGSEELGRVLAALTRVVPRMPSTSSFQREYATVLDLGKRSPGDAGILVALLLNRVSLARGQALYLPSGNMHAYLHGTAIEIMAASDNVIRGGLTSKHVDVDELQEVVRFEAVPPPILRPEEEGDAVDVFRPDVPYFTLVRVTATADAEVPIVGPAILLALGGGADVTGARSSTEVPAGGATFVTPDEGSLRIRTTGTVFIATTNP
jgi:mannose-6-phosphate isomerase